MSEMSAKMELLNFLIDSFKQAKTLAEENKVLRARVAELEEAHRWIPVTERLPDYSIHVYAYLGHLANSANIMKLVRQYDNTWRNVAGWEYTGITHWQPLPSGPKEAT